MKAYSYVRFSSKRQMTGHSLKRQHEACQKFCTDNGLILDSSLSLKDLGVSAFRSKNLVEGALSVFLKAVDDGVVEPGSFLIVESFDRLSRDRINKAAELFFRIINAGITLVTLLPSPEIYTSKNCELQNVLVALLVMARANEESETKSNRVKQAWSSKQDKARTGTVSTSKAPGWLTLTNGKFKVNEHGKTVKRIFDLSSEGHGSGEIARKFNAEQVPTWGYGTKWNSTTIRFVIVGRAVLGELQPTTIIDGTRSAKGEPIIDYYPRVIDDNLWSVVNAKMKDRSSNRTTRGRKSEFVNLFQSLLWDARTKTSLVLGCKGRARFYFSWKATQEHGTQHCIDVEAVETAFLKMTKELSVNDLNKVKTDNSRQLELEGSLAKTMLQIGETEKAIEDSEGSIQLLLKQLQKLETKRDELRKELDQIKTTEISANENTLEHVQTAFDVLTSETDEEKLRTLRIKIRGLIASLVDEIWIAVQPLQQGKRNLVCKMQVFFKAGGCRDYHILKLVGSKKTKGSFKYISYPEKFDEPFPPFDLRKSDYIGL